ncbi:phosphoadenosine phosphosulfate reductase family protein [Candidatus Dependentiae bacterium]|nr:phosphoadenosine phosphosulfate reductase family protein [Candidatus Dependentiae bacterium]
MELVINFSGGKDSCAMLAYLCDKYPQIKKHVIFADTGWEHKGAEDWCRAIVESFGLELVVVRNPNKTFLSMVQNRGKFPGMKHRQCTSDLKRGPIQTWIRNNCGPLVINCMGLRASESPARAKKRKLYRSNMTNSKRTVWDYLPIHTWSDQDIFGYLETKNIPLHPVYSYLKRFSCRVCIYMSTNDLLAVKQNDPEAISIISDLEQQINFSLKQEGFLAEIL